MKDYTFTSYVAITPQALDEQITLPEINLTSVGLRASFNRMRKIFVPTYKGYKDYLVDHTYWTIENKVIHNVKPIMFPPNNTFETFFINTIEIINHTNTLCIHIRLKKPIYLSHEERIVLNSESIYIIAK